MGCVERRRDLSEDRFDFAEGEALVLLASEVDDAPEGQPFEELHGEERPLVRHPIAVNVDEVGLRELARQANLGGKGFPLFGRLQELGRDGLDRHRDIQLLVKGLVDLPHGTGADESLDSVALINDVAILKGGRVGRQGRRLARRQGC